MSNTTRRDFVAASTAALLSSPLIISSARAQSPPSNTIQHAVIGTGRRGGRHISGFAETKGCKIVAVCDVDPIRLNESVSKIPYKNDINKYSDFRKLLEDDSIDSVSIATPDHWHTSIALSAILAGKHVYLEKPCSHNVEETHLLIKAAKEYKKCVQHGTQRRSEGDHIEAMRQLQDGIIGNVHTIKAINHQHRKPIGRAPIKAPPSGVDYDMWLGPAPKMPFTQNRWHYNWHWFWDYGGGDIVNDGVHHIDLATWMLNDQYPNRIIVSGGQFYYDDDHQTPDTQTAVFEYDETQIIYEMRLWTDYKMEGHNNGTVAYGTDGKMDFGRDGIFVTKDDSSFKIESPNYIESIVPNFLTAVRDNNPSLLNSPIDRGATAVNLCNLANIATRLGAASIRYDPITKRVTCPGFDNEARKMLGRTYREGYELPYNG